MDAREIIRSARDRHPSFTPQQTPDAVALRGLNDYQRELVGRILTVHPEALSENLDTDLPLAAFDDGITLPDRHRLHDVEIRHGQTGKAGELGVISFSRRNDVRPPAAYVLADVLHLVGTADTYTAYDRVRVRYVPLLVDLADLDTALTLPETTRRACVAAVAMLMASRGSKPTDIPPASPADFAVQFTSAEASVLFDLGNAQGVDVGRTRRVW